MSNIVSMIKCPRCNTEWIREDTEGFCDKCLPHVFLDKSIQPLIQALADISVIPPNIVKYRLSILETLYDQFSNIIDKAKDNVDESGIHS